MPASSYHHAFELIKEKDDHSVIVKINEGSSPNDVLNYYLQQDSSIISFNEILPSLNEIFIQLVEGSSVRQFQNLN
jgi:ABC-2 type transport system ATP-binding protein